MRLLFFLFISCFCFHLPLAVHNADHFSSIRWGVYRAYYFGICSDFLCDLRWMKNTMCEFFAWMTTCEYFISRRLIFFFFLTNPFICNWNVSFSFTPVIRFAGTNCLSDYLSNLPKWFCEFCCHFLLLLLNWCWLWQ